MIPPTDRKPLKIRTHPPIFLAKEQKAASVKNSRLFLSFSPKIKFKHRRFQAFVYNVN
jgi:hypothetical protein